MWWRYIVDITNEYKILRGMLSYSALWPLGCLLQQTFEGRRPNNYDWERCLRYSLYGTFISAPMLYTWMRTANMMWPRTDFRSSLAKAFTEQAAFDPFAIVFFLYGMSILERKPQKQAANEVRSKFWDTYKVGFFYWPVVQTVNFSVIPAKNQIIAAGFFSLIWTTFLAYIKTKAAEQEDTEPEMLTG
ncbi:mpv17-like protein [Malaya genurostris]|uniref:mpv17-like protein n=1 Tax=Malaya genurostris TaxID=325434 RepID=UPI0026F3E01C|nr:mpv17-like protein [Malaya genurostris]XP_058467133.1 mpv17-like protein [Malaya genurostris]XP_058467139.1 mpv17-like protein [Malaya genurostris]XP_058467146.1 mpv17-like protein [Malaya genurostris]XP_058467150.1 mpv17-like protein [Malaya genurostris]XP_058467153.1 mpv17-like protein [Malaya genurostris]XP_058467155.1 mpv17-like protein [Malaya genurostris]XP_058467157.1 mpv17-like protein [Malaya genurostris]